MATNSLRFNKLKECDLDKDLIARRLKLSKSFLIDQARVQIDTVSKFSHGAFAKVVRASYIGAEIRVKRIHAILTDHNRLDMYRFLQECRLASGLRHPNVVHFYGVVMDGRLPMLMMEELVCNLYEFISDPEKCGVSSNLCDRGLNSQLTGETQSESSLVTQDSNQADGECSPGARLPQRPRIKESHKVTIALGIAQGLEYLHTKYPFPIVHRDLSSCNILLGTVSLKTIAKIADFGQSKEIKSNKDWSSYCPGTLSYLPPEVMDFENQTQTILTCSEPAEPTHDAIADQPVLDDIDADSQIPEAKEPDEAKSEQEQSPTKAKPQLTTSIDMYMFGVLITELSCEQHPSPKEKNADDPWHRYHESRIESLDKDSVLCQVARCCIKRKPSERSNAGDIVHILTQSFASPATHTCTPNQVSH